jgi:polysaccharide biosynthesis protein PslL
VTARPVEARLLLPPGSVFIGSYTVGRLIWLDALKGFAVIAVVAGHVVETPALRSAIYLWHMPLFFFLTGYTFRPNVDLRQNTLDKAIRLLVPYAVFLVALSIPDLMANRSRGGTAYADLAFTHLMGGRLIGAWLVAMWFVTCLFLTLVAANYLVVRVAQKRLAVFMVASVALAYALALFWPEAWFPWNAQVCLVAVPLLYLGWQYRQRFEGRFERLSLAVALIAIGLATAGWLQPMDMKQGQYGTPLASLTGALAVAVSLIAVFRRLPQDAFAVRCLARLGEASMTIMFLHWTVQYLAFKVLSVESPWLRIAAGVLVPFALHQAFVRSTYLRALLLGSVADFRTVFRRQTLGSPQP